jgi:plasmid stabilization system protein ParE
MPGWILSPLAAVDLEEILDYIAADSGSQAVVEKVAGDFATALDALASSPGMGWQRIPLTGPEVRWWRVHSYLLVYDADSRPLRVIRIVHGARDLESIFTP